VVYQQDYTVWYTNKFIPIEQDPVDVVTLITVKLC